MENFKPNTIKKVQETIKSKAKEHCDSLASSLRFFKVKWPILFCGKSFIF